MKKMLLITLWLFIFNHVVAYAAKPIPAVQRSLARQLTEIVVANGLSPLLLKNSHSRAGLTPAQHYADGYRDEMRQALTKEAQILDDYAQLLSELGNTSVDMHALAHQISTVMNMVGQDYAQQHEEITFKTQDNKVIQDIVAGILEVANDKNIYQRAGEISLLHLYDHLRNLYKNDDNRKELQAMAEDEYEFLKHYPELDSQLTHRELDYLLDYAHNAQATVKEIESEIGKVLTQSADALFDITRKNLTVFDLADPSNNLGTIVQDFMYSGEIFLGRARLGKILVTGFPISTLNKRHRRCCLLILVLTSGNCKKKDFSRALQVNFYWQ